MQKVGYVDIFFFSLSCITQGYVALYHKFFQFLRNSSVRDKVCNQQRNSRCDQVQAALSRGREGEWNKGIFDAISCSYAVKKKNAY